jgi:hypothetical protein
VQIHHVHQPPITLVPPATLQNTRLTFTAIGVLGYIASFPEGHHLNAESIAADSPTSLEDVRAALTLLIECGYLRMQPRPVGLHREHQVDDRRVG